MYSGGNFSRSRVERFLGMRGKKAGQTKTVISKDVHIGEGVNQVALYLFQLFLSPTLSILVMYECVAQEDSISLRDGPFLVVEM